MVGGVLGEQPVVLAPSPNNKTSQPSGAWAAGTGRRSIAFVAAGIQICGRRIVLFTSPTRLLRPRRSQIVSTPPAGHPGVSLPGPMDALPKPECARSSCSWRRTSMLSLCIGPPLRARATSPGPGCIMFPPSWRPAFGYHNGDCCHARPGHSSRLAVGASAGTEPRRRPRSPLIEEAAKLRRLLSGTRPRTI